MLEIIEPSHQGRANKEVRILEINYLAGKGNGIPSQAHSISLLV